jgi:hypothetical protein
MSEQTCFTRQHRATCPSGHLISRTTRVVVEAATLAGRARLDELGQEQLQLGPDPASQPRPRLGRFLKENPSSSRITRSTRIGTRPRLVTARAQRPFAARIAARAAASPASKSHSIMHPQPSQRSDPDHPTSVSRRTTR